LVRGVELETKASALGGACAIRVREDRAKSKISWALLAAQRAGMSFMVVISSIAISARRRQLAAFLPLNLKSDKPREIPSRNLQIF
jgi:hypothetical protein